MPEGYTHARIALAAAAEAGWEITSRAAFLCGAGGPDVLYAFEAWKPAAKRRMDLAALGRRMHTERTGAFLHALQRRAVTPVQMDYFLGFLCHYFTDCAVHPYVAAVTAACRPYQGKGGHGYFESALDSLLHRQDTGSGAVPVDSFSPPLTGVPLAEVVAQLQLALLDTYGVDVPREYLTDALFDNRRVRGWMVSRRHGKYLLAWLLEPLFGGRGAVTQHMTPRTLRGLSARDHRHGIRLPCPWTDPFSGAERGESLFDLLALAQRDAAAALHKAQQPNAGADLFWPMVGSRDYVEGCETPQSTLPAAADA